MDGLLVQNWSIYDNIIHTWDMYWCNNENISVEYTTYNIKIIQDWRK